MFFVKIGCGELEEIASQFVLVAVQQAFQVVNLLDAFLAVFPSDRNSTLHTVQCFFGHRIDDFLALRKSERRVVEESRLELVHIGFLCQCFLTLREEGDDQFFKKTYAWCEKYDYRKSVERVCESNSDHVHLHLHEAEVGKGVNDIEYTSYQYGTENIDDQVYKSSALAVGAGAESAEHYRHRSSDADTHQDREGHVKLDRSRDRKSLKYTDGCARALDDRSHQHTDEHAQYRIREACHHVDELRIRSQRDDGS